MSNKNEEIKNKIYAGYMKRAEMLNKSRVSKEVRTARQNRFTALLLTCFVGSVYLYSMAAVKQEKFLDEVVADESPQK